MSVPKRPSHTSHHHAHAHAPPEQLYRYSAASGHNRNRANSSKDGPSFAAYSAKTSKTQGSYTAEQLLLMDRIAEAKEHLHELEAQLKKSLARHPAEVHQQGNFIAKMLFEKGLVRTRGGSQISALQATAKRQRSASHMGVPEQVAAAISDV